MTGPQEPPRGSLLPAMNDIKEFHEAFGVPVKGNAATLPDADRRLLRRKLIREEVAEFLQAEMADDIVEIADALGDIMVVVCGTAHEYGINLPAVWDAIHKSNMAKLGPDGKPIYREDGKILKPEGWQPPDIRQALGFGSTPDG